MQVRPPLFLKALFANSYVKSAGVLTLVTAIGLMWAQYLQPPNIDIVYMLAVLVSAIRWGRRVGIFAAITSTVVFDFCFIPPPFSFAITDVSYVVTLTGFVAVAIAMSELAGRSRQLTSEHEARVMAEGRNQAKDEILNKIVHEMRTPLTVLMGRMQMLAEEPPDGATVSRSLSSLQQNGRLLARLIDDLLSASRINSGKLIVEFNPTSLSSIVAAAVESMRVMATTRGVTLTAGIEPVGEILGDEQRISQIVTNLLSNAIKFTPRGGEVSLWLTRAGDDAIVTVRDTGRGIPTSFLPHVFDQFSQADTKHATEGLGLGLAIVKHLVAAHGGTLFVTSEGPGCGTAFTIQLPTLAAVAAIEGTVIAADTPIHDYSVQIH